jgi:hypothetical protein
MANPNQNPQFPQPGSVLGQLFLLAKSLARAEEALVTGLLFAVASFFAERVWGQCSPGPFSGCEVAALLGFVVGVSAFMLFFRRAVQTACLASTRELFLRNLITAAIRDQMRKKCLKGSLLYK